MTYSEKGGSFLCLAGKLAGSIVHFIFAIYRETPYETMYFLTEQDLQTKITTTDLFDVTGGDDTILDMAELNAMDEIDTYLRAKYNMPTSWAQRGSLRYNLLIQHLIIIMLYHIHTRIAPNNVPQSRIYDYDNTIKFLQQVRSGNFSLNLPSLHEPIDPLEPGCGIEPTTRLRFASFPNEWFGY